MRLHCPHCRAPLNVIQDAPSDQITCPSCGSRIPWSPQEDTLSYRAPPSQTLGPYELLEIVGRGAFGVVWKARDTRLGRIVALKLPYVGELDATDIERFRREAAILAQLKHPHIVAVHDIHDSPLFFVTEFINGPTLSSVIKGGMTPRQAAELLIKVAEAVGHAHAAGIVHRDLKPRNIMLDLRGEPTVLDFGLAKRLAGEFTVSVDGNLIGTPEWIAPELLRGGAADKANDLWALGVILYEMLCRRRPFQIDSDSQDQQYLYHQILHANPQPPSRWEPSVPRALDTICVHALKKDPRERYQSAAQFVEDLRCFVENRPLRHAKRPALWSKAVHFVRANAALVASSLLALGGLVAAAVAVAPRSVEDAAQTVPVVLNVRQRSLEASGQLEPLDRAQPTTSPFQVVFWPLDPFTLEPNFGKETRVAGTTPVRARLKPGRYLVVADVPGHGFQEVYRTVPPPEQKLSLTYLPNDFRRNPDGSVSLPAIHVPPASVTRAMVSFPGADQFEVGSAGLSEAPPAACRIQAFHVDPTEFTLAQVRAVAPELIPRELEGQPPSYPVTFVNHDAALHCAEVAGKRLLSEFEHEYVRKVARPLVAEYPESEPPIEYREIVAVDRIEFDRLEGDPPIVGLEANVAEWCDVGPLIHPGQRPLRGTHGSGIDLHERIVRGGGEDVIRNRPRNAAIRVNPSSRIGWPLGNQQPGLGFRCAVSGKPRLHREDFSRPLEP